MVLDIRPDAFRVRLFEGGENEAAAMGRSMADWAGKELAAPACLVLTAGL